jgi:predicted DNA-binding transcriptional regulator AlpA
MKIDTHMAAIRLGVARKTLASWRGSSQGPPYYKLGARVVYDEQELDEWLKTRRAPSSITHGRTVGGKIDSILTIWRNMKNRCLKSSDAAYDRYGGRGIKVCERWLKFENFLADMGERPPGMTLDRIDNNLGYCPENCRWASYKEQNNNRRDNRMITFKGETKNMAQWCTELGLSQKTISQRINGLGWSGERALSEPIGHYFNRSAKRKVV